MSLSELETEKLLNILFPFFVERKNIVQEKNTRFVYYCTAQTASSIIQNREIWMREAMCMNDSLEIRHGLNCLSKAYNKDKMVSPLKASLSNLLTNIDVEVENLFNSWKDHFETQTYLTCFSEHDNSEDVNGRLSMWRAYGGSSGVALVIKNAAFFLESDMEIFASPVEYLDDQAFEKKMNFLAENIQKEADFLRTIDRPILINTIFTALKFAAVCTKHPGFLEEREWRLICSPTMNDVSKFLKKEVETINGIPQIVYKIPLRNKSDASLTGIEIPELIERVIIGPNNYPLATWKAFVKLLNDAGMENAEKKVVISGIPLRA